MPIPIGGAFISSFGGILGFQPFQGLLPGVGAPPPTPFQTLLDVERWELAKEPVIDDTTHTGSYGALGSDITCVPWRLAAELLWDIYKPPNFLAANGGLFAAAAAFNAGYQFWAYLGSGANYPLSAGAHYYFCPSVKTRLVATIIDAAGKKMVRARIDVLGNAPVFALGGPLTEQGLLDNYIFHCQSRNWVW